MAKIPRIEQGTRPSAVPGGGGVGADAVASPFFKAADLGESVMQLAAAKEQADAEKIRAAMEAKQAIVNEVGASRAAGDYEEALVGQFEGLKKAMWDTPDQLPDQLLAYGREAADRSIQAAPNTAEGLERAQRTASRLDAVMREAHNWVQLRQTQKAKNDLTIITNRATAGAENQGSVFGLDNYIKTKSAELAPVFHNVLGGDAEAKLQEMRTGMARAWVIKQGSVSPISTLMALDSTKPGNPLVDHLNVSERDTLVKETKSSLEGLAKTRDLEAIKSGIDGNRKLAELFMSGAPNFIETAYAQKTAIQEQRKAVKAGLDDDLRAFKSLGIAPVGHTTGEVLALLDEREQFNNALSRVYRRQTAFDAPDDPTSIEALLVQQDKALKSNKGKDLAEIARQQTRLAVALDKKTISGATAQTMFKDLTLAMDIAASKEEDVWGPNTWRLWRAPREAGNVELNRQFSGAFQNLSKAKQQAIRLAYMMQFNTAQEQGAGVSVPAAREMALRALALETGEHVPGVR